MQAAIAENPEAATAQNELNAIYSSALKPNPPQYISNHRIETDTNNVVNQPATLAVSGQQL